MDSFDTILEQLKQAQEAGKNRIFGTLEGISEKFGRLVDEAKAEIGEAAAGAAEDIVPIESITEAVNTLRAEVAEKADESAKLAARVSALEAGAGTDAAPAPGGGPSLELLRGLDAARSQSELLHELLPALCDFASRAVVLVIRESRVSAWSGVGFSDAEKLRTWQGAVEEGTALARMVSDGRSVAFTPGSDSMFAAWLADETPATSALLVPVVLRGNLMGGMYIDNAGDGSWAPEEAQALVAISCWMIDTLSLRQTVPSPMLAEKLDLEPSAPAAPEVVEEEPEVFAEEPTAPSVEFEPEPAEEPVEEPVEEPAEEPAAPSFEAEVEPPAAADAPPAPSAAAEPVEQESEFDPSATMRVEVAPDDVEPAPEPAAEAAPAVEEPAPAEPPPVSAVVPPPPLEEPADAPESGLSPEEEAQYEEARRFARLLISEIKLYNEEEVDRGRAAQDIYQRLKEDIDRSREMYDKRISEDVRGATDYFQEELVRILAEGDADALGM